MPFFKKVVTYKGLKFKITKCKMFVFKRESKFDMEAYVSISGLLCGKFKLLRSGVPTVPLPIQPLYTSMLPINPANVDVLRLKKYLINSKAFSYYDKLSSANSINHDNDNDNDRLLM
jgi:hypothetical protein